MRKQLSIITLLAVLTSLNTANSATPPSWTAYNHSHSGFEYNTSSDAQDGTSLAKIDNTQLVFSEELFKQLQGWRYPFSPQGYLVQKVNARPFKGKHLHVSAFARAIQPELDTLESWFDEQYKLWQESELASIEDDTRGLSAPSRLRASVYASSEYAIELKQQFSNAIKQSNANARYGIWVLLHMPGKTKDTERVQVHRPTSLSQQSNPELWHRFNVEVSIPRECNAISIVFWADGVIKAEVDHFAIVEHGEALKNNTGWRQLSLWDALGVGLNKITITANANFENLSFEAR